jgi:hypothetical protein
MATASVRDTAAPRPAVQAGPALATGVVAGLAGGVGFGILMQTSGMLPLVANLVGGSAASLGWVVHMAISVFVGVTFAILGVSFALLFSRVATGLLSSMLFGLLYGAFWWVLGGMFLMPVWLGMQAFSINEMAWRSLVGHLIYGLLLGLVYGLIAPRLARSSDKRDDLRW